MEFSIKHILQFCETDFLQLLSSVYDAPYINLLLIDNLQSQVVCLVWNNAMLSNL
jgi:hypothetical protein